MKVAIVGTGVSGLAAAWALDRTHEVTLFEAAERPGGHVHTHSVDDPLHGPLAVDSGFIVYNERNYPGLVGLLDELGVASRESDMSFAVGCRRCRLEFCGRGAAGLFAERRNMIRPGFLRLLTDIGRFFRAGRRALGDPRWQRRTIGDFLDEGSYGRGFQRHFIAPMGAAIWSSSPDDMRSMPAAFFLGFFDNHGLLGLRDAPLWRTVDGGSRRYVDALLSRLRGDVRLDAPVRELRRDPDGVELRAGDGAPERFDRIVIATHPKEALALLADPSDDERASLGRLRYSVNEALVHTDASLLPRKQAGRASWNVTLDDCRRGAGEVAITYWMNRLQGLPGPTEYCVSLNGAARVDPSKILARASYEHPIFTLDALRARHELLARDGQRGTHFAGAYLGAGFHEDGLRSGYEAAARVSAAA
ncbi:MAG TPA: FAD-dependent oxidoreductase [Gaiellales bacterium]